MKVVNVLKTTEYFATYLAAMASQYGTGNKNPPWARQATGEKTKTLF